MPRSKKTTLKAVSCSKASSKNNGDKYEKEGGSRTSPAAPRRPATPWHLFLYGFIESFAPEGVSCLQEYSLNSMPRRIDMVLIKKEKEDGSFLGLDVLFSRLFTYSLLEFKGPSDALEADDLYLLRSYADQFITGKKDGVRREEKRASLKLFTISDGIAKPFLEELRLNGARTRETAPGVLEVEGFTYPLVCLDTSKVWEAPGNHLLYMLTKEFLEHPAKIVENLDMHEIKLYSQYSDEIVQLWREKDIERSEWMKGLAKSMEEARQAFLATLSPKDVERFLQRLPAEERLRGLPPSALRPLLKELPPEERLRGLPPEERLRGLPPEERLRGLRPEDRARLRRLLDEEDEKNDTLH